MTDTPRYRSFTGRAKALNAIARSPCHGLKYTTPLEGVTLRDGSRALHYVLTFRPETAEQRAIIAKARFRCADDAAT